MSENDELLFDEEEIEEDDEIDKKRKIFIDPSDPEIDSLHKKYKKGRLNIQPSYQRQFVWDNSKSSRLIESALLEIPIPTIYLSEEINGGENVIDGQQRLTSFFSFIDGEFPDKKEFKLTGLKVFSEYNGKKFNQLPDEIQEKIITYHVRVIKFRKESDPELQFEIFSRLNTGSVALNAQELRNCVYRGKFNSLIIELSEDKDFKKLMGMDKPEKRMKDRELVLRFAAFHFTNYLDYVSPLKKFLNNTMEKYISISDKEAKELKDSFKNAVSTIYSIFGKNSFKRFYKGDDKNKNGHWELQKFNNSLYDILMYSFSREDRNILYQNQDRIKEALIDIMTSDEDFINSIEMATSNPKAVIHRFDKWRMTLQPIIGIKIKEPRCFSFLLKDELFKKNQTCAICGNQIQTIDDAAVDHIEQYWTGGQTIDSNARLTHRFCNNSRPRKEQ
ncbi:GmrSD restriction endonuclease domain-containing protein [Treponema endosymbiont of Eucomonympha sp.]|uniref:GmrSD restriction endonuclease domain-containing protein n=1 Tax=Treponema endosymbiont of Eucomonympha sp. TaxID=1580831 RepID=UPI000A4846B0|nr:DUF262 domain-containing protein [Treponema endosymbiont of Eucomonympha sp.]